MYVFVGERRSRRAMAMGVTWRDGRLAAKTLHEALRAAGIEPAAHLFANLYFDDGEWVLNEQTLAQVRAAAAAGETVVAMGRRVQQALTRAGVPFRALVHPAARGSIRRTERYQQHVAAVLR